MSKGSGSMIMLEVPQQHAPAWLSMVTMWKDPNLASMWSPGGADGENARTWILAAIGQS